MRLAHVGTALALGSYAVKHRVSSYSGGSRVVGYAAIDQSTSSAMLGRLSGRLDFIDYRIDDSWSTSTDGVRLTRQIWTGRAEGEAPDGLSVELEIPVGPGDWKFFVPAACYDYCPLEGDAAYAIVSEERMAGPFVAAWHPGERRGIMLLRAKPASTSEPYSRDRGSARRLHLTDLGALGYRRASGRAPASLFACVPYREEPTSRMIDRSLTPFSAFQPPLGDRPVTVAYRLVEFASDRFDDACLLAFSIANAALDPQPVALAASLDACIAARLERLRRLARNDAGHTGLALNFDPRVGESSSPSGYGTSFNELNSELFPRLHEYGFTGRQLNNAYMLALVERTRPGLGAPELARAIVTSYLDGCATGTGFLHTLYDVERHSAISPFGDPVGSALHYGVKDAPAGNYVRNMAEAALDLCLYSGVDGGTGALRAARGFGDFLLRVQNHDGSWFRAYTVEGHPIRTPEQWFGGTERANKSSSSAVVPFLAALHEATGEREYLRAAARAGEWLLKEVVDPIDYRGGTLDNPNVVDKEGMAYAGSALLKLYQATFGREFLDGAKRAAGLALTWNYLWDVPFERGTRLCELDFRSRGWGGISILWGAGVVDNYSLWFLEDWLALEALTGEPLFGSVSRLVLSGTQQMLSLTNHLVGLFDTGLQEEGFACSDQGVDERMIAKGSTWGSLGWVFGAGTYGPWRALHGDGPGVRLALDER